MKKILFILFILLSTSIYSASPLEYYGIIVLDEKDLGNKLATRLNAKGDPVFLVSDTRKGLIQGDMIRFKNKIILIDADVWQTLKNEGILKKLKKVPVISLVAGAKSKTWKSRKDLVTNEYEQKGYLLGSEILKILEEYFDIIPKNQDMVISFNGKNMTLTAPYTLLKPLKYTRVEKTKKTPKIIKGTPEIVSLPPEGNIFSSKEFNWTAWGVDPGDPSGNLKYSIESDLPKGLSWDISTHSILGQPDTTGTWEISIKVENSFKLNSVFNFTLTIITNSSPTIDGKPEDAYPNDIWSFKPFIQDKDHYITELKSFSNKMPKGMNYNIEHNMFYWKVPTDLDYNNDTLDYKIFKFDLCVYDPLNDSTREEFEVKVFKPEIKNSIYSINIKLPVDTIIQGKLYSWADSTWLDKRYNLLEIKGEKLTYYEKNSDSIHCLNVKAYDEKKHILNFTFKVNDKNILISKEIPVKKNLPPQFVSKLSSNIFTKDQDAFYKPILIDKENDKIFIRVHDNNGTFLKYEGDEFKLNTGSPGNYIYEISALDELGNEAIQIINYTVVQKNLSWTGVKLTNVHRDNWNFYYEGGNIRSGIFIADIGATFSDFDFTNINSPFLFVGVNLLGKDMASKGNTLFFDGGITLRNKNKRITSGGIFGRLETEIEKIPNSDWEFEGIIQLYAKQALLILDTNNLSMNEIQSLDRETLTLLASGSLIDGVKKTYPPLGDVLDEYGEQDNVNMIIRLQSWYPIKYGFWFGPVYWYENRVTMGQDFQFYGLSLRHKYSKSIFNTSQSLRFGLNGKNFIPNIYWDFKIGIGKKI